MPGRSGHDKVRINSSVSVDLADGVDILSWDLLAASLWYIEVLVKFLWLGPARVRVAKFADTNNCAAGFDVPVELFNLIYTRGRSVLPVANIEIR